MWNISIHASRTLLQVSAFALCRCTVRQPTPVRFAGTVRQPQRNARTHVLQWSSTTRPQKGSAISQQLLRVFRSNSCLPATMT